ncbi:ABC transporter permease [Pusillimonas sp. SM2304]|uniref:ABC transporter permease n=1 Tax=Pusillimonas sp. SM2304 TaxID=3073241 RepID=UPI002876D918|nr:ABC transporter permease [Pusillimonas sp. SM2304]MDS1139891.1 ABC transporter permease [Pusillimonas sp. SM2304]
MIRYILRRFGQSGITVLLVTLIIFIVIRQIGDPTHLMLPPEATEADRQILREQMGLDRSLIIQYGTYLRDLLMGDLGMSYRFSQPALSVVVEAFGPTLLLTTAALVFAVAIGLPLGVLSAVHREGPIDQIAKVFAVLGQAAPPFLFSLLFIRLFSIQLGWLPTGGYGHIDNLLLPMVALGWYSSAGIMRLTRSSMTEVLESEYIKLARIKGVPQRVIVYRHALKNALLPVITFIALQFGILMGGAVSVEFVFAWPGVGRLMIESISNLDYTVVQAAVTVGALVFTTINLTADILYAAIDPRIRYA